MNIEAMAKGIKATDKVFTVTGYADKGTGQMCIRDRTKAVCRLLSPLASLQDKRYEKLLANQPLEHDPVFILGHWVEDKWCKR